MFKSMLESNVLLEMLRRGERGGGGGGESLVQEDKVGIDQEGNTPF